LQDGSGIGDCYLRQARLLRQSASEAERALVDSVPHPQWQSFLWAQTGSLPG
jgi:hypothetical protein